MPTRSDNRYLRAMGTAQNRGSEAEDFYFDRATTFDPTEALERYGAAAYGDFSRNLDRRMERSRGDSVGMGRLDTGFAVEDEDRVVIDLGERYGDDLASQSLGAAQLEQRNFEGVGSYGAGRTNTYLDMLSGQMDRETDARNSKRDFWGNLLGSVLGAGGRIAGAKLGGK